MTPSDTMKALAAKKNKGMTWQEIADELGDGITAAMVWKVTKGLCESSKIDRALGFGRQYPPTLKIRKDDLDSAVASICNNYSRADAVSLAFGILAWDED